MSDQSAVLAFCDGEGGAVNGRYHFNRGRSNGLCLRIQQTPGEQISINRRSGLHGLHLSAQQQDDQTNAQTNQ